MNPIVLTHDEKTVEEIDRVILTAGEWKSVGHEPIEMSRERIDALIDAFDVLDGAGDQTPVMRNDSQKAFDVLGKITAMHRDGDKLVATHRIIGQRNIEQFKAATATRVKIGADVHTDNGTRKIGEAILHSWITALPIAASSEQIAADVQRQLDVHHGRTPSPADDAESDVQRQLAEYHRYDPKPTTDETSNKRSA